MAIRTMQRYLPVILMMMGGLIILAGFVYDIQFAGIPYQDPTEAMLANYRHHASLAASIRWSGMTFLGMGACVAICRMLLRWVSGGGQAKSR